ncbi:MAG: hypothetical protein KAW88_02895 [Candidatus Cloacimonetes bacterium]|nr:hypothetical protein [Candidatus Cloacimonadota bacterium]
MKDKKYGLLKRITILSFLWFFTSLFCVTVLTVPNPTITEVSVPFEISINIDDSTDIRGYKIIVDFNPNVLVFSNAEHGTMFAGQPIGWWIVDDEIPGSVRVECIIFGAGLFVTGPGNILNLTFTALSECITYLVFTETELYDPAGLIIPGVNSIDGCIIIGDQPTPPQNLTINIVETSLILSWEEVQGCTYNVYSTDSLGNCEDWQIESTGLTQCNWNCPLQGTRKFFYVTAEFNLERRK